MKALVTGGSGFLGSAIISQLHDHGYHTIGFSRNTPTQTKADEWRRGDLCNADDVEAACRDIDVVFHCAAKVGPWGKHEDFYRTNVQGTDHVIHGCRQHGVPRLIYTSSPSVIFGTEPIHNGDERLPYPEHFLSHYQATKALAEQHVLQANNPPRLRTTALRPHAIWGAGDTHFLPRIIKLAQQNTLRIIGKGENKISVTHVDNAALAHLQAATSNTCTGKAYFINDPQPVILWKWIAGILKALNIVAPTKRVPYPLAYTIGALSEFAHHILPLHGEPRATRYVVQLLAKDHYFSTANAQRDFAYSPKTTHMQFDDLIQYFQCNERPLKSAANSTVFTKKITSPSDP